MLYLACTWLFQSFFNSKIPSVQKVGNFSWLLAQAVNSECNINCTDCYFQLFVKSFLMAKMTFAVILISEKLWFLIRLLFWQILCKLIVKPEKPEPQSPSPNVSHLTKSDKAWARTFGKIVSPSPKISRPDPTLMQTIQCGWYVHKRLAPRAR